MTKTVEIAYAKINLTLDVIAKRSDGYHDVKMIMQTISLADTLELETSNEISLTCDNPTLPTNEKNLAYRAAQLLLEGTNLGVAIKLNKRIPLEAGLAGGSSDAAAVLRGVNKLYQLNKSPEDLQQIAKTLGADVPFCLQGGTALAEGIGERLTMLPQAPKLWLVLVKPTFGVSTALVYKTLNVANIQKHPETERVIEAIFANDHKNIVEGLVNVLEEVTLELKPELKQVKKDLMGLGAENVLMSGSGPTIFGVFSDEGSARAAAAQYNISDMQVFVAHTN